MASVDRIVVQIHADRRLARVVKTVVSVVARGAGVPAARASAFGTQVARRFTSLSAADGTRDAVELTLEPVKEGLDVEIRRGVRRQALKLRRLRRAAARRPASRRR